MGPCKCPHFHADVDKKLIPNYSHISFYSTEYGNERLYSFYQKRICFQKLKNTFPLDIEEITQKYF